MQSGCGGGPLLDSLLALPCSLLAGCVAAAQPPCPVGKWQLPMMMYTQFTCTIPLPTHAGVQPSEGGGDAGRAALAPKAHVPRAGQARLPAPDL